MRASVIASITFNYRTIVASDAVGDRALRPHAANLSDIGQKYADLMTVRERIASSSVKT